LENTSAWMEGSSILKRQDLKSYIYVKAVKKTFQKDPRARCRWLTPVILATQEAEISGSKPAPGK
jgi:hypothetical protein